MGSPWVNPRVSRFLPTPVPVNQSGWGYCPRLVKELGQCCRVLEVVRAIVRDCHQCARLVALLMTYWAGEAVVKVLGWYHRCAGGVVDVLDCWY